MDRHSKRFVLILGFTLVFMAGCSVIEIPAPKQFDCGGFDGTAWYCKSRATDKCIRNEYVDTEQCSVIEEIQ